MYTSWNFKQDVETDLNSLDELKEHIASDRQFEFSTSEIQDISFDEGLICTSNKNFPMTKKAFKDYCRLLGIPDPFARKIPTDLLYHNIDTLKARLAGDQIILVHDKKDKGIIRINKAPFVASPVDRIVDKLSAMNLSPVFIKTNSDRINMTLINEEVEEIMVEHNDPTKLGFCLRMSDATPSALIARAGLWRFVCSNGVILGQNFGFIRQKVKVGNSPEIILNTFFEQIANLNTKMDKIKNGLVAMVNTELTDREAMKIWSKVKRHTSDLNIADSVLGISEDERKALKALIRARDVQLRLGAFREDSTDLEDKPFRGSIYNIYNQITDKAKGYPLDIRLKLETIGGELFNLNCIKNAA